jgi:hypothetical protein
MSWDIFVQDFPKEAKSVMDIPDNYRPKSIGTRSEIITKIIQIVPSADFSDPSWGLIDGDDWSIEVNLGADGTLDGFAFHVRGGDAAAGVVAAILDHLKLRAVETGDGDFFEAGPKALEAFGKWRAFRDRVVNAEQEDV